MILFAKAPAMKVEGSTTSRPEPAHPTAADRLAEPAASSGRATGNRLPEAGEPRSTVLDRWLAQTVIEACGNPSIRLVLWDGARVNGSSPSKIVGDVIVKDRATLWQLPINPNVAFGDAYAEGRLEVAGSLVDVLCAISRAQQEARPRGWLARLVGQRRPGRRAHTVAASRESVHHHYDIGNDFYRLWLDENLLYTCAYYAQAGFTLEQAQTAKMDHVCRKLRLRPGEHVVEAGCGWGGLALHMAERYGAVVRAYNLSREQVRHAREWAAKRGLTQRVEFVEDDYRAISGEYDAFVSVGMLEHVGLENFEDLGLTIDRALTPAGRGLIHSIGRNAPRPLDAWTDKRIFPGAYPPAISEMMRVFEPHGLSVLDLENIRLHYARTLEHWLERFERSTDKVRQIFDERFVRTWRMYLAGSIAAFRAGTLQLFQVLFAKETNNDVPWTRDYMYAPPQKG